MYYMKIFFFKSRLSSSQNASVVSGGGFFSWGTKFRYSGRTEREILSDGINALRQQINAHTSPSKRKANSVPATPSSPQGDLAEIRYSSLPRSTMSEPPGCSDSSSAYCPENTLPLLEPVSEEARRHSGFENDPISDYYYRDSFEHSSSESGLTCPGETHIGLTHRPGTTNNALHITSGYQHLTSNNSAVVNQQNATNSAKHLKKFSIINAFIPSFIFVVIFLILFTIYILETESELFLKLKNLPEMLHLKRDYYLPVKEFFLSKINFRF